MPFIKQFIVKPIRKLTIKRIHQQVAIFFMQTMLFSLGVFIVYRI